MDSREEDKRLISDLIEVQLSNAFRRRDVKSIKTLWPDANETDLKRFKEAFEGSKEFSRDCKISKWDFRGNNEAEVREPIQAKWLGSMERVDNLTEHLIFASSIWAGTPSPWRSFSRVADVVEEHVPSHR